MKRGAILLFLCSMAALTGCGQTMNKFSAAEKSAVLDTLANNFATTTVDWARAGEPSNELVILSMSLVTDDRLLEEYKQIDGITHTTLKESVNESVQLRIAGYSLTNENGDSLKIALEGTVNYDSKEEYFSFSGLSLREKDGGLYFNHWIHLKLDAPFKQLKGYIDVEVYFPEKNRKREVRIPVNISTSDDPDSEK